MRMRWFFLAVVMVFVSCRWDDERPRENPGAIRFTYNIWGNEDAGYVTVRMQYQFGGRGTNRSIKEPGKVEFDGVVLKADSSKMNGAYYEVIKPVNEFTGKHTIIFTMPDQKQHREEFEFRPISLLTEIPAVVNRGDLVFELEGLDEEDYVQLVLTDTASFSEGIVRTDTVMNGKLTIKKEDLDRIANGPVYLELTREEEKVVRKGMNGGILSISYGLKREFELKDE